MAAPSYVNAGAGSTDAGGAWSHTCVTPAAAGNIIIVHMLRDGMDGTISVSGGTNIEALDGTDNTWTEITGGRAVGNPQAGLNLIWIGRALSTSAPTISGGNTGTSDIYIRSYEFSGVSTGTTLASVIENVGGTGPDLYRDSFGTGTTATDAQVTTSDVDRLALNFFGADDDVAIDAFTGMSGGTWAEAVAEYATATGTDGCVQLQTATLASAGTIDGGSDTIVSANWGVVGFALIPAPPGTPHTVDPADSLALTDARSLGPGKGLADTLALADARAIGAGKGLVDTVVLADARAFDAGKALADSVALADLADPVNVPGGVTPVVREIALLL